MVPLNREISIAAWTGLFGILVAIILTMWLIRMFAKPIIHLSKIESRFARGEFSVRADLQGRDEIGTLGKAFDNMAAKIQISIQSMQEEIAVREKAEKAAEAANRSKSIFLAKMSHELRTPLNAIIGFSQLRLNKQNLEGELRKELELIYKSGKHLLTLINDILDLSRVEIGKIDLYPVQFSFKSFISSIKSMVCVKIKSKDLRFMCKIDHGLDCIIEADETRLRQILLNLLGNAVKFTCSGNVTLVVLATKRKDEVNTTFMFEVIDTGIGIKACYMGKYFKLLSKLLSQYCHRKAAD